MVEQGSVAGDIAKGGQHCDILQLQRKRKQKKRACKDAVVNVVQRLQDALIRGCQTSRVHMKEPFGQDRTMRDFPRILGAP
jgi:hypothetical protein